VVQSRYEREGKTISCTRSLAVEFDREEDGRWIAEIPKLSGVMAYGATKEEAEQRVYSIANE